MNSTRHTPTNLQQKAKEAYEFALTKPGAQQTASVVSPYIYAEDNWADDMELAAIQLDYLGQAENISPML